MNKSSVMLTARGIQKSFKKGKLVIPVLRGVDFEVSKGETVAIIGSSGAGKSTLLHILGTLDEPTTGKVYFNGKDVFADSDEQRCKFRNRHLGFVFQFHYLLPEFSAIENVMMPGLIAGRNEAALKKEAEELLQEVGLSHRLNHRPSELSGGESQRVAIARSLIMNPDLLLGDELTGNLDYENSNNLISILTNLNKKRGVTLVIVTHDRNIAKQLSRTVEIRDGKIV